MLNRMAIHRQPIKLTYSDGKEVVFESIKDVMDETGYSRAGIWFAINKYGGKIRIGKDKNIKIERI